MTTNNPQAVVVAAEIDIHQVINAVQEFAEKYPAERLSIAQTDVLQEAIYVMLRRMSEWKLLQSSEKR